MRRLETLDLRTEKVGEEVVEEEEVDRTDTTTEEACVVGLASLVGSDQEVVAVAAVEEAAEGEEEVEDVEVVTVVDAGLPRVTGRATDVMGVRVRGIGGNFLLLNCAYFMGII
jgi:hypothetical protein